MSWVRGISTGHNISLGWIVVFSNEPLNLASRFICSQISCKNSFTRLSPALLPKACLPSPMAAVTELMGHFCPPNLLMELRYHHACFQTQHCCQSVFKWSFQGWKDLLPLLPFYSHSVFQTRFPLSSLPSPEQQVAETPTDLHHTLWVRMTPLRKGAFPISPAREEEQLLQWAVNTAQCMKPLRQQRNSHLLSCLSCPAQATVSTFKF